MPTQFYNRISTCDTDKVGSSYSSSSDKLPAEMWKCRFLDNQVSKDLKESTGYSYTYVATGDDAEKIYQWYQGNSKYQKNMIQEAGNGWAEVQYLSPKGSSSTSAGNESLFYYPKDKQLVVTSYSSYARDNSVKEWALPRFHATGRQEVKATGLGAESSSMVVLPRFCFPTLLFQEAGLSRGRCLPETPQLLSERSATSDEHD